MTGLVAKQMQNLKLCSWNRKTINLILMKLTANYSELSELLLDKTGKDISLEYGGNTETVLVRYMHVPCRIRIEKVDVPSVTLSYSIGGDPSAFSPDVMVNPCPPMPSVIGGLFRRGAQALGNRAIGTIIEHFVEHPAVSVNEDKTLNVDLSKISQLDDAIKLADIADVSFNETGATLDVILKTNKQI